MNKILGYGDRPFLVISLWKVSPLPYVLMAIPIEIPKELECMPKSLTAECYI
jgi:hypothetical protein